MSLATDVGLIYFHFAGKRTFIVAVVAISSQSYSIKERKDSFIYLRFSSLDVFDADKPNTNNLTADMSACGFILLQAK